jgi:hypothetical protein
MKTDFRVHQASCGMDGRGGGDFFLGKATPERPQIGFGMKSSYFSIESFQPHYAPEVGSACNKNEYQESSWR